MGGSLLPASLLLFSFLICKSSAFVQCYYPDGSIPTDYIWVPCTNGAESSCCIPSEGDICQDNGLCYYPPYDALFRGACTDQTWKSSACPKECVTGYKSDWSWVLPCSDGTFGCGGHDTTAATCAAGVRAGFPVQTVSTDASAPTETAAATITVSSSPTQTTSPAVTTSPAETSSVSSPSQSSSPKTTTVSLTPGAIAGIAAGPTVALLVGLAILYIVRRNQKRKQERGQKLPTQDFPLTGLPSDPKSPPPSYPNSPINPSDQIRTAEIHGQQYYVEIDGRPVWEK